MPGPILSTICRVIVTDINKGFDHGQFLSVRFPLLKVEDQTFSIYRLDALEKAGLPVSHLPFSLKILLENLLRHEDGVTVTADDIKGLAGWNPKAEPDREIAFRPSRVLLQDFTGVPAIVDLAAMRDAMKRLGGDPKKINPLQPVELVIDHSVQVDEAGTSQAFAVNAELEFRAQSRAVRVPAVGAKRLREFPGGAARHGDRAPGQPRIPGAGRLLGRGRKAAGLRWPIPTRWSAPIRTRR